MNKSFKSYFSLLILTHASLLGFSQQNLVPNGSFENYSSCPQTEDELYKATGWDAPNLCTTDYINTCGAFSGGVQSPYYFMGYQNPFHGNAYVGLGSYCLCDSTSVEYAQCKLNEPLKAFFEYQVTFYVCLANHSEFALANSFGAFLSDFQPYYNGFIGFTYKPQVAIQGLITDTLNWTKVTGNFIAKGGEQFLTIGRFDAKGTPAVYPVKSDTNPFFPDRFSYYLIDSISMYETRKVSFPNSFSPNGDGVNDGLSIEGLYEGDQVVFFNRWGVKIYEFAGEKNKWDGRTTSGEECSTGVYYYIVKRDSEVIYKGFVQLLR